jgi:hypothetical protein
MNKKQIKILPSFGTLGIDEAVTAQTNNLLLVDSSNGNKHWNYEISGVIRTLEVVISGEDVMVLNHTEIHR